MIDTEDDVILVDTGLPKETPGAAWDGLIISKSFSGMSLRRLRSVELFLLTASFCLDGLITISCNMADLH